MAAFGLALGGGGGAHAQAAFTDWSSVLKLNSSATVGGVAQEFAYKSGPSGVTSIDAPSTNMAMTFTQTVGPAGDIVSLVLKNANRTVTLNRADGATFTPLGGGLTYIRSSDWTNEAMLADPLANGWAYQSFAVWQSGIGQANGSMGATSVGSITPGTSVPQTGAALFYGLMGGLYNDASGQGYAVGADMLLGVDFAGHSADFVTFNTYDRNGRYRPELNITGTFVSLPNHPALFGTLVTANLTGTSSAQFYGSNAGEVGGVFTMSPKSGTGLERLVGAFGGKRSSTASSAFTSWRGAVAPGLAYTVVTTGRAEELTITDGVASVTASDVTFRKNANNSSRVVGLQFEIGARNIGLNAANGDYLIQFSDDYIGGPSADQNRAVMVADAIGKDWNYQTFGVWQSIGGGSVAMGAASVGAATPASAVPTSGSATFNGVVGGTYVDAGVGVRLVSAPMTLTADFSARQAAFKSSELNDTLTGRNYGDTGLSGTLSMSPGQNQLTGTLSMSNGRISGTATGRFYGLLAQEVGGTFVLGPTAASSSLERFVGAFGAKR